MFEEGLELLLAVVQRAEITGELLDFVTVMIQLMESGGENIKRILHILEGYVITSPIVLQKYTFLIVERVSEMLGSLKLEASNSLLRLLDLMLQANQSETVSAIYGGTLISKLFLVVLTEGDNNQVIVGYLLVICRLIICDSELFVQILDSKGALSSFLSVLVGKVHV